LAKSTHAVPINCGECKRKVPGKILGDYQYHDAGVGPPTRITLLVCPRCQRPILIREEERWEDQWSPPEVLYPHDTEEANPELPDQLQAALREARLCYEAKAYTATAICCRRAIEGLCANRGIKGTLAKALEQMKKTGVIDGNLFEWADGLRLAGNEAAHDVAADVSWEDARDLIQFTEALLEYVVVFRERFERFKARRKKSTETAS
jgi:hypothetical protein